MYPLKNMKIFLFTFLTSLSLCFAEEPQINKDQLQLKGVEYASQGTTAGGTQLQKGKYRTAVFSIW